MHLESLIAQRVHIPASDAGALSRSTSPPAKPFTPKTVTNSPLPQSKPAGLRQLQGDEIVAGPATSLRGDAGDGPLIIDLYDLAPILPTLAAALAQQHHLANTNALIQRLGHVIDRQRRDRSRHHRLHLHAGSRHGRRRGLDRTPPSTTSPAHRQSSAPADDTSESDSRSASPPESPQTAPPPADSPWDSAAAPPAPRPTAPQTPQPQPRAVSRFPLTSTMRACPASS